MYKSWFPPSVDPSMISVLPEKFFPQEMMEENVKTHSRILYTVFSFLISFQQKDFLDRKILSNK